MMINKHALKCTRRARCYACTLLVVSFVCFAQQNDRFQQGLDFFVAGNYEQSLSIWKSLAVEGDMVAAFNVGVLYSQGLGVPTDNKESIRWYREAADTGYAPAQFNLGIAYLNGQGVEADPKIAAFWWDKAANQDYPQAISNLASLYVTGSGVGRDVKKATKLYLKAERLGDKRARAALDKLASWSLNQEPAQSNTASEQSRPEQSDPEQSTSPRRTRWVLAQPADHYTIQVAAFKDEPSALAFFKKSGIDDDIALFRAKTKSQIWFKGVYGSYPSRPLVSRGENELKRLMPNQSLWVRKFESVQKEIELMATESAAEKRGADGGLPNPGETKKPVKPMQPVESANLGRTGTDDASNGEQGSPEMAKAPAVDAPGGSIGDPVSTDSTQRVVSLQKDTGQVNPADQGWRGQMAYDARRYSEAYSLWRPLAESGDPDAQYNLAALYGRGEGVERDEREAYRWYRKAAANDHRGAQFELGLAYGNGSGVERNESLSQYWIQTAADGKEPRAIEYIKRRRTQQ